MVRQGVWRRSSRPRFWEGQFARSLARGAMRCRGGGGGQVKRSSIGNAFGRVRFVCEAWWRLREPEGWKGGLVALVLLLLHRMQHAFIRVVRKSSILCAPPTISPISSAGRSILGQVSCTEPGRSVGIGRREVNVDVVVKGFWSVCEDLS